MAQVEQLGAGDYRVSGIVDFSTVTMLMTQIRALSVNEDTVRLDFSQLERANSAGLALLMELLANARRHNQQITFTGLPDSLLDLARMSNVEHLVQADG